MQEVVVLANGEFPKHEIPKTILENSKYIICCDGAVNELVNIGLSPFKIIGDLDSIDKNLIEKYSDKIIHIKKQTDTDLEKSLKYCIEIGIKSINVMGLSGKRDDHFLSNIFLCWEYRDQIKIQIYSDFGEFEIISGFTEIKSYKGQQISIFSNSDRIKITTKGLKYNLNMEPLTKLYKGVCNESINEEFTIDLNYGTVMIYKLFKG